MSMLGRSRDTPELLQRMTRYLAEATILLDRLPSAILEELRDYGMEGGCRVYRLTDLDIVVTPDTVLHAFDIVIAEALEVSRARLADMEAFQAGH